MFNFFKKIFKSSQQPATDLESLRLLYSETAKVIHIYFEWRHKVISFYLTALGAFGILAGWISDHPSFHQYLPYIFFLGAFISVILSLMDDVNTKTLGVCFKSVSDIEKKISIEQKTIYMEFNDKYQKCENGPFSINTYVDTYADILSLVYRGSVIVCLVSGFYFLFFPIELSSTPDNKCFCCTEISEKKCIVNKVH
ncbi:hypothetical protein C8R26_13117 [Nitrosomonas oligotropha]|uniref:Uncharacterized protein n=1 Tax=Nitrosomonas oligotropha TaxID=42354 RepID=A0A2T5HGX4_9PROT|nr:hypothetical protein [Nitrosomonas oligotropha]PTQ70830.1 hypothetical protein C8R26_13117 [Nitrosomonas oligotropha]